MRAFICDRNNHDRPEDEADNGGPIGGGGDCPSTLVANCSVGEVQLS